MTINIRYQAHVQNIGWQGWVQDGQIAGTTGQGLRMEALMIGLTGPTDGLGVVYQAHVENVSWQELVANEEVAGTTGQGLRMEAIKIVLALLHPGAPGA